jgi:hypothetical protein
MYTVHLQRGSRVGTRSLRIVRVKAASPAQAIAKAWNLNPTLKSSGYRVVRIDYTGDDGDCIVMRLKGDYAD